MTIASIDSRGMRNAHSLRAVSTTALALMAAIFAASPASAAPVLGSDLASFTVLGSTTVTNVSPSTIGGSVGVWQSGGANAITGFLSSPGVAVSDPQVTGGLVHAGTTTGTPNAMQAQAELTSARDLLSSLGQGTVLGIADLVGRTLYPGVYTVQAGVTNLSGALTLDGQGNANAFWVFQMESTLITSPNAVVNVINTGSGAGLYWNVASSATIDVDTAFMGNILALASISMNDRASNVCGRALADTGAVTLIQNDLSGICAGPLAGSNGLSGGLEVVAPPPGAPPGTPPEVRPLPPSPISPVPEPGTVALVALGFLGLRLTRRR
jgi:hypothetical protein